MRLCDNLVSLCSTYVYVHSGLVPDVMFQCFVLVSFVPVCGDLQEACGLIVEFIVFMYHSLIFVRIFYLRSVILLCIGPY